MDKGYKMDALRNIIGPYDLEKIREMTRHGWNFRVGGNRWKEWLRVEGISDLHEDDGARAQALREGMGTELLGRR